MFRSLVSPLKVCQRTFAKNHYVTTTTTGVTALNVFQNSCYSNINFKINENSCAKEAISRFTAFNVGCLAVVDDSNAVVGVCAERDYISKVAALDKNPLNIKVKDICTYGPTIIVARADDSIHTCMNKMLFKEIRHLIIMDNNNDCIGMISIRDLIKEVVKDNKESITRLTDFNLGKGAYLGSE
jgi:predicted transcriptional regulator